MIWLVPVLQVLGKEVVCGLHRLVKPDLFAEKRMGRVLDDGQVVRDVKFLELAAKQGGVRTRVIVSPGDKYIGRVLLIQVMER